jgi:hypothetical protein
MMRTLVLAAAVVISTAASGPAAAPRAGDVAVTVTYAGKAKVDTTHEIWVFLFDTPDIGPGSQPVAVQAVTKSGATATFKAVQAATVYVAVAYDEKGDYDGNQGPPPPGTPIAIYAVDGKTAPVTPGAKGIVKLTFDESRRMQ